MIKWWQGQVHHVSDNDGDEVYGNDLVDDDDKNRIGNYKIRQNILCCFEFVILSTMPPHILQTLFLYKLVVNWTTLQ